MTRKGWIVLAVVVGFYGALSTWIVLNPGTEEQRAASAQREADRKAREATRKNEERAKADFDRTLCEFQETCAKYAKARQDCAVAGDFAKCLEVRMSTSLYYAGMCSNDGQLTLDVDVPGTLRCLAVQWLPASN